jgi:hypothetical protein
LKSPLPTRRHAIAIAFDIIVVHLSAFFAFRSAGGR